MKFLSELMPRKLSQKMIISLTIILLVVGSVSAYMHVKTQQAQLLEAMVLGADRLSGSIASATWHSMLADQREAAYGIMQTIALKQGINRIRIFNKEGRIMFSTSRADTGQVDKDAEACSMCHSSLTPLVKVDAPSRARVFRGADGNRTLGMVTPIYNEPSCSDADCHAHPRSMTVLGVVDVSMDLRHIDDEVDGVRLRVFLITSSLVILMSIFIVLFTRHFVDAPIKKLIEGTRAVSAMDLDTPVAIDSSEELGELGLSFDAMRQRLKGALAENARFMQELETKVEERTRQLNVANRKLLQTDRMASLGQLAASVAHEINNPLSGVLNLSMLLQRIVKDTGIPPDRLPEFRRYLAQVVQETARVGRLVQDLLAFSRRSKPQQTSIDLNALVSTTINLLDHKLKLMNVTAELHLDPQLPRIWCDGSQMQQVLINLIMNAAEAAQVKPEGRISVSTRLNSEAGELVLAVTDNGDGIPPEYRARIFEPFFTTKGEGKGVGLGLAVVYGIVEAHRGSIDVESDNGAGTTFTVLLPLTPDPARNGGAKVSTPARG